MLPVTAAFTEDSTVDTTAFTLRPICKSTFLAQNKCTRSVFFTRHPDQLQLYSFSAWFTPQEAGYRGPAPSQPNSREKGSEPPQLAEYQAIN